MNEITQEQIAKNYSAMLDSVNLINAIAANTLSYEFSSDDEKDDCVKRNVAHLELMLAKDYWTDEDMTPVQQAIVTGNGLV